MTTIEARVMRALESWEAETRAAGLTKCECCDNWHRGESCPACEEIRPTTTLAMLVGLAMLAK